MEINKIYNGDAYELIKQIPSKSIDLIYTDPPFNIGYHYKEYNDKKSEEEYLNYLYQLFTYRKCPFVVILYPEILCVATCDMGCRISCLFNKKIGYNVRKDDLSYREENIMKEKYMVEENIFIKEICEAQNKLFMTNVEFAKYLGITAPTLISVKKGKPIFAKTARKICEKLNITSKKVLANISIKYYS